MIKLKYILAILIGFLMVSCSDSHKTIYLKTDNALGITTQSSITKNGNIIGHIDAILFDRDGEILIKLLIDKDFQLPEDTEFFIESQDILGNKRVTVLQGTSHVMLSNGDTIEALTNRKNFDIDVVRDFVKEIIELIKCDQK